MDIEAELEDWYKVRVRWRSALREFQLQRARNGRLAKKWRRVRRRHNAAVRARQPKKAGVRPSRSKSAKKPAVRKTQPPPGPDPFLTPTMKQQQRRQRRDKKPPSRPIEPDDGVEIQ